MDANQTRFHLLLGADDWQRTRAADGSPADATWVDPETGRLTLRALVPPPTVPAAGALPDGARSGAARDREGNFYRLDQQALWIDRCLGGTEVAWESPSPGRGLAITGDDVLAIGIPGSSGTSGLWILDLLTGAAPQQLDLPCDPTDLAATGQDLLILDAAARQVWRVRAVPPAPRRECPIVAAPGSFRSCSTPAGWRFEIDAPLALPADATPTAITAWAGRAVVLDGGDLLIEADGAFTRVTLPLAAIDDAARPHDVVISGEALFAVDARGTATFALDAGTWALRPDSYPMRGYTGIDLVSADGTAWYRAGDGTDNPLTNRWIELRALPRASFPHVGARVLPGPSDDEAGFDSGVPGCVWHRVVIDACVPAGSRITLRTRAADTRDGLARARWTAFGAPLRTFVSEDLLIPVRRGDGSELPYQRPSHPGEASWDALLPAAVGRYLEIELGLESQGRRTPEITALRVYGPRFSYLDAYLPAVFRSDPVSASFLARFLANLEGVLTATEDRVAAVQVLFHPDATSPELLPWLAGWFDATLSPEWSEAKRRFFLRNAMSFFHWRGTARGLRLAARVALAPDDQLCDALLGDPPGPVRIVERFTTRAPLRAARLSAATGIGSWDPAATWSEAEGATGLLGRWRALHPSSGVPLVPGIDDDFLKTHLGFVPTLITDLPRWRAFLRRRHRTPAGMSTAWGRTIVSFDAVQAPDRLSDAGVATHLPNTSAALADWLDWQRLVVPARLAAHRFTVVLQRPDEDDLRRDPDLLRRIKDAVVRVIQAEKPAHTAFDVVYDDLLFRPEHNRLGRDSVVAPDVEVGSALELGAAALGETWVVAAFPVLPRAPSGAWLSPVPVPPEST